MRPDDLQPSTAGDHEALLHNLRVLAGLPIPKGAYAVEASPWKVRVQGEPHMDLADLLAALGPYEYESATSENPYDAWEGDGFRIIREARS